MSIPADSPQWGIDSETASKNRTSVEKIQHDRASAILARETMPGTISAIDAEIEAAEAARQAALAKKREVESTISRWDALLDQKNALAQEIIYGESRLLAITEEFDGRLEFLNANLGGLDNGQNSAHRLSELGGMAVGAKYLRDEILPKWIKAKKAELAAAEKGITDFAKKHNISTS